MTNLYVDFNTSELYKVDSAVFNDLVSKEAKLVFQWICYAVLGQVISVFGILTNIINIICFVKQGFKDPVNISLLGLAISDLLSLLTVSWTNICYNPALNDLDLPFDPIEIQILTGGWLHVTFTHVTMWITAFIDLERCLGVSMPLKVKTMITAKRVTIIIVSIYALMIACVSPIYCISSLGMKYFPARNTTILGIMYSDNRQGVEMISHALNNVLIPFGAFTTVIICTVTLVFTLKKNSKWREKLVTSGQSENLSNRDQKVTKMVIMISTLFIACFFPICVFVIAMLAVPELSMGGQFINTLIVIFSIGFILESTNSAMNIFIYYQMSSKYRTAFGQIIART